MGRSYRSRKIVSALAGIASAVVTTVLGGVLLHYLQLREPDLVYAVAPTSLLVGQSQTSAMYNVSVSNKGEEIVENVDCHVVITGTPTIEDVQIAAAPAITYSYSVVSNSMKLHFPWLNPLEEAQLRVLATSPNRPNNLPGALPSRPIVSLRGKGVSGVERSGKSRFPDPRWIIPAALVGCLTFIYTLQRQEERITPKTREKKAPFETNSVVEVSRRVFIVHGHDEEAKQTVARCLEKLELEAIVLREQPSQGRTIIEKFEDHADVGFVVVLLTPDDVGAAKDDRSSLQLRARQNVVFEMGFFSGKLGRQRVCALHKGGVEIPSDFAGVVWVPMDPGGAWRFELAREMKAAGLDVDSNKLL